MKEIKHQRLRRLAAGLVTGVVLLAMGAAACGNDNSAETPAKGPATTAAFLKAMVPHHEAAVEMAEIATKRAQHREVKRLADDIISAQKREIRQMEQIYERLFGSALTPNPYAHEQLGLSMDQAGMAHVDHADLQAARPFDRAFIDAMIPHHQGAIRMSRVVAPATNDAEIDQLAQAIIEAQSHEIRQMNEWRTRWYGKASPAGGVPAPGQGSSGPAEGHEGGH